MQQQAPQPQPHEAWSVTWQRYNDWLASANPQRVHQPPPVIGEQPIPGYMLQPNMSMVMLPLTIDLEGTAPRTVPLGPAPRPEPLPTLRADDWYTPELARLRELLRMPLDDHAQRAVQDRERVRVLPDVF